jgi:hypothetical protein
MVLALGKCGVDGAGAGASDEPEGAALKELRSKKLVSTP